MLCFQARPTLKEPFPLLSHERLVQRLKELAAVTEGLKATAVTQPAHLIEIENEIATELNTLSDAVEQRLRLSAMRDAAVIDLAALHAKIQNVLEPLVDDAGFNLVINSEDVATKNKEEISGLVEGGVKALQALLTLSAEGNLAAGLLTEAAHAFVTATTGGASAPMASPIAITAARATGALSSKLVSESSSNASANRPFASDHNRVPSGRLPAFCRRAARGKLDRVAE